MLIAAGTILEGKYRIERLLGAGGMGSVWIGEHTLLGRPVAVKVLDKSAATRDATAVQRFLREAQTAARLRSDHIVDVLDVGRLEDGTPFLVMELLEGEPLSARIRTGRLSQASAADLVDQLLAGLSAAHDAGVIHRDIKPDNCFIVRKAGRDHLKLLDFGISKVAGDAREMRMTRTGVVMGTPYYMAPEQARGAKEIDHRCDLYAAGAILYECVTGRVPFDAESVNELLFKIVLEPIVPPRARGAAVDEAFEALILRAMARDAGDRFPDATTFREALRPFVERASGEGSFAGRIVVSSAPPVPARPHAHAHGLGNEATTPIDSDGVRAALASSLTPSGLQGLSATGPLRVSSTPSRRGRAAVVAVAGSLVVGAGVGLVFASREGPRPAANVAPLPTEQAGRARPTSSASAAESSSATAAPPSAATAPSTAAVGPVESEVPSSAIASSLAAAAAGAPPAAAMSARRVVARPVPSSSSRTSTIATPGTAAAAPAGSAHHPAAAHAPTVPRPIDTEL
jgi:serine/threonine-protein kinase